MVGKLLIRTFLLKRPTTILNVVRDLDDDATVLVVDAERYVGEHALEPLASAVDHVDNLGVVLVSPVDRSTFGIDIVLSDT